MIIILKKDADPKQVESLVKWLKDRKGRTLTSDDIMHYKAIIIALMETSRLMAELSALANPHSDRSA